MAKAPNLSNVTNIYTSAPTINANNERIREAFQNTLSRDGSTPNQMEADLDMNSNDILNVGNLTLEDGRDLSDIVDEVEQYRDETKQFRDEAELIVGSIQDVTPRRSVDNYIGDGVTTEFATSELAIDKNFTNVFVSGIYQNKDTYEVVGGNIVFSEAPPLDAEIEITVLENSTVGTTSAEYVAYGNTSVADVLDDLVENAGNTFSYNTRQDFVDNLPNLQDGLIVFVRGQPYIVDSTATGMDSGMWDIGVDGVRAPDRPLNAYVAAFHDHNSPRVIRLYSSVDGKSWRLLNSLPLEHDSGVINGGNPVLCYRDGWFWLLVSFTSVGNYDFRIYKTRDFSNWLGPFNCNLGPTPVSSNTNPAPGASVPCNEVWGVDMSFTPAGELHVRAALPYAADITDVRGRTIGNRRVYRTVCTDLETLTFSAPELEDIPSGHPTRLYQSTSGPLLAPTFPLNHQTIRQAGDAGLEMGFAERFCAGFELDDLIIIPCGKGGTGFIDSEWTAGGAAYTEAVNRIQAVIAAHPDAVVEGVLWHQGERDRGANTNYQADLTSLITRLRSDIPALAGKPFVMGEIGRFVSPGSVDVNAIMHTIAGTVANTAVVSSEGLTDRGDSLHFNAPSYRRLGTRYWDAFSTLRGSVGSGGSPVKRIIVIAGQSNAVGQWTYTPPSMIDASVTRTPSDWLLNVKDSSQQTIRVYNGPSITGPWEFQEEVENTTYAIEGSSIVPRRLASGGVAWDLYCEGHNTIPDWISAQLIMVYRGNATASGWGAVAPTNLRSTRGIRHGTPLNLGFEDPAAFDTFERFAATTSGDGVETNEQWNELLSGNRTIVPNPGAVYYVTGGTVTNLTILDSAAEEFYIAVLSINPLAGINIVDNGKVLGSVNIGFGSGNNRLVRFVRREDTGRYHAEAGAGRPAFAVNKGGTGQTVPAGTLTAVTFSNEVLDVGGHFSASGWTPPAGRYLIKAAVTFSGATADQTNTLRLLRNGVSIRRDMSRTTAGNNVLSVSAIVSANGTDTFTLDVEFPGTGDKTISGTTDVTWFEGVAV